MCIIQLLKIRTWETRLFKTPCFDTPHFQMGMRVTIASGLYEWSHQKWGIGDDSLNPSVPKDA